MNYREPGGKTARCWRCPFLYGGPPSFDNDVCMHPEWHGTIVVDDRPHDECLSARESVAKRWTHGDGPKDAHGLRSWARNAHKIVAGE